MALSDHVQITISKDTVGIARAGFGVPLILSYNAAWTERVRSYNDLPGVQADFSITSPEYRAATALLSQTPKPKLISIGRAVNKPTQVFALSVSAAVANNHYYLQVDGDGVTSTLIDVLTTSGNITFGTIDATANTFVATAHGMQTGDGPFRLATTGTLPAGSAVDTDYWIINIDANTIKLATSKANAIALTALDITTAGSGTNSLLRIANDVIVSQLVQALNAVVGKNFTAADVPGAGDTDTITVTANTVGAWFSVGVIRPQDMAIKQTHVDTGIAADLDACLLESDGWYALITTQNSKAIVLAAAAWVEANDKVYIPDVNETEAITVAVGSGNDTGKNLQASAYSRTMCAYHPIPAQFFAAAWFGRCLPLEPGSETWNDKTLAGPQPVSLTSTHRLNLKARNMNSYQVVAGLNKTFFGKCADGEFFDTIRGLDWFTDDASKSIYEVMSGADKIPFEDDGIVMIEAALRGSLKRAEARKIFAKGSTDVQVPMASEISQSDKANRIFSGMTFIAELSGAIQEVDVTGVVTA